MLLAACALAVGCTKDNGGDDNSTGNTGDGGGGTETRGGFAFVLADEDHGRVKWDEATAATTCVEPYRLPNRNELQLIWVYRDAFADVGIEEGKYYWSSTQKSETTAWYNYMSDGRMMNNGAIATNACWVRCIKDSDEDTKVYPYVTGGTGGSSNWSISMFHGDMSIDASPYFDSFYIRCVKTVE